MIHDLVIFLCAAVLCVPLARRAGLSAVLGYLAAGMLIGPSGLGLITADESLLHFSEFGVVLLLFLIGLELQPRRLWRLRQTVFLMGGAQVLFTAAAIGVLALPLVGDWRAAAAIGLGLSLSSTAMVLQMFAERGELTQRHARAGFGVLLFQDLAVLPMLLAIPVIATGGVAVDAGQAWAEALKLLGAFAAFVVVGRLATRPLLHLAASAETPEVFTAAALLLVVGSATLMDAVGLSASLGAFVAGVLLADSEFRHQVKADIEPFKGLLLGLFFIAVGMGVDLDVLSADPLSVLALALVLMLAKFAVLWPVARLSGLDTRTALLFAVALAQGGEFAFVLFGQAAAAGLMAPERVALLNLVVALSMMVTPLAYKIVSAHVARREPPPYDPLDAPENPVIIAGFGPFGQIVGRILHLKGIGFTVLERDYRQVDFVRQFGHVVFYGDASRVELLRAAHADRARAIVVTITEPEDSLAVVQAVRRHFPNLEVFAAASTRHHVLKLMDMGVRHIIRRSFYSSLEMSRRLLLALGFPPEEVEHTIARFREHDENTLIRQHALAHDEKALIQSAQQAAQELKELFDADRRRREEGEP